MSKNHFEAECGTCKTRFLWDMEFKSKPICDDCMPKVQPGVKKAPPPKTVTNADIVARLDTIIEILRKLPK